MQLGYWNDIKEQIKLGMRGGAAAAFDPLSLSPTAWWDFSDISTLYQDDGATTPVTADGDVIGYAVDKTGNGNDVYCSVASRKTLYKTGIENGLSVARFDGVDDILTSITTPTFTQPYTWFVTVRIYNSSGGHIYAKSISDEMKFVRLNATDYRITTGIHLSGGSPDDNFNQHTVRHDGASTYERKNGVLDFSGDSGNNNSSRDFRFGHGQGGNPMLGDIGELFLFLTPPSDTNRDLLEAYQKTKWGTP